MTFKTRDLVIVLGDCDLRHEKCNYINHAGEMDLEKRIITVAPNQDPITTYATIIHEALHYHYEKAGIEKTEKEILKEERELMYRWFGAKKYWK
jgi:hypothetical protein